MSIQIINGIQLPAFDVDMLTLGKLIAVPFNQSQKEGKAFWLYPSQKLPYNLSPEQYYHPEYLTNAKIALAKYTTFPIHLTAWARCERHWHINPEEKNLLLKIAQSTIWNLSALEHMFEQYQVLKLLILRVYRLSNYCMVNVPPEPGAFYWSKSEDLITTASESDIPVVYEASFNKRKTLLLTGNVYPYREIEALQFQCEHISDKNPDVQRLNYDIKQFLGCYSVPPTEKPDTTLDWINDIAKLGDRSIEQEEKKNNHQAGTDFEIIVRRSLEFLGFKVEEDYKGGAGGLDLFCSQPYPLVCECKAGKSIPHTTVEQLDRIGKRHLKENYMMAVRLIIGPGQPTKPLKESAQISKISIINAMTLQKLVELKAKYPGSVNLVELKQYLEQGQIDNKIDEYINQVEKKIALRSHIIKAIKELGESERGHETVEVRVQYNAVFAKEQILKLEDEAAHDLLIELSSPLTGYLGRIKGSNWRSDRFYFLRDLPTS